MKFYANNFINLSDSKKFFLLQFWTIVFVSINKKDLTFVSPVYFMIVKCKDGPRVELLELFFGLKLS
jgi:hypothetical protein